jgi:hypothetical protein
MTLAWTWVLALEKGVRGKNIYNVKSVVLGD